MQHCQHCQHMLERQAFIRPIPHWQMMGFALDTNWALLGGVIMVAFMVHLVSLKLDVSISVEACSNVTTSHVVLSG
jgi:hypothetical protein